MDQAPGPPVALADAFKRVTVGVPASGETTLWNATHSAAHAPRVKESVA